MHTYMHACIDTHACARTHTHTHTHTHCTQFTNLNKRMFLLGRKMLTWMLLTLMSTDCRSWWRMCPSTFSPKIPVPGHRTKCLLSTGRWERWPECWRKRYCFVLLPFTLFPILKGDPDSLWFTPFPTLKGDPNSLWFTPFPTLKRDLSSL